MTNIYPILAQVTPASTAKPGALPQGKPSLDASLDKDDKNAWERANGWTNGNPFNNGWRADHITFNNGLMTLNLDNSGCPQLCSTKPYASAEYRTSHFYHYGLLEGRFKAAKGDGLVTSLFFYTGPSDGNPWDEIDIEILGKDTTKMQINYYTNGVGNHEKMIDLGFDAAQGLNKFAILWEQNSIRWYVNDKLVQTENGSNGALPTHAGKIMVNLWPGIGVDGWLKPFKYSGPVTAEYDWIKFTPLANLNLSATTAALPAPVNPSAVQPAIPSVPSLPANPNLKMPPGFERKVWSPAELIESNKNKIADSKGRENKLNDLVTAANNSGMAALKAKNPARYAKAFQERIIQWMLKRENGAPDTEAILNMPADYIANATAYWKTKAAFLIATGEPTAEQITFLHSLGFIKDKSVKFLSSDARRQLLQTIDKSYNGKEADSLLKGEIQLQLSFLAANEKEASTLRGLARVSFEKVIKSTPAKNISNEDRLSLGSAQAGKAQLLILEAGKAAKPAEAATKLIEAYQLLKEAVPHLEAMHYQQLKQLAAECLIRLGFFVKDFGSAFNLPEDQNKKYADLLKGIQEWEQEAFGKAGPQHNQSFFRAADTLIEGVDHQSVINWENDYLQKIQTEKGAIPSVWLKQITTFARIWQANQKMVTLGDERTGEPIDYLLRQAKALAEVEKNLHTALKSSGLSNAVAISVQRTLAENLARQAFISMDFGVEKDEILKGVKLSNYRNLLKDAEDKLDEVLKAESRAKPEIAAEARVWKAKILLARAGKELQRSVKEKSLSAGLDQIRKSFGLEDGKPLLKGAALSAALQTMGDILVAQKNFRDAEKLYLLALGEPVTLTAEDEKKYPELKNAQSKEIFAENHFARVALGDLYSWQKEYKKADAEYKLVLDKAGKNHPAYRQAELGLMETGARREKTFNPEAIEEEVKVLAETLPPASPLIPRALKLLLDAYKSRKAWQERILLAGNKLLGTNFSVDVDSETAERINQSLAAIRPDRLDSKFKAELYITLGQALTWKKRYKDANTLLTAVMPENYKKIDDSLSARFELTLAEIKLREDKTGGDIISAASKILGNEILHHDLDLFQDAVKDLSEAYETVEDFEKMIYLTAFLLKSDKLPETRGKLLGKILAIESVNNQANREKVNKALNGIAPSDLKKIFLDKGLDKSWEEFEFELYLHLIDGLTRSRHFSQAQEIAEQLKAQKDKYPLLNQAEVGYRLGEIYRYGDAVRNYKESKSNYEKTIESINKIEKALRAENAWQLLAKAQLGLALLEQQAGHPDAARNAHAEAAKSVELLEKAGHSADRIKGLLANLKQDAYEPNLLIGSEVYSTMLIKPQESFRESRQRFVLQAPLYKDHFVPYLTYEIDERTDSGGQRIIGTPYVGIKTNIPTGSPESPGGHLTLGARVKIPNASRYITIDPLTTTNPMIHRRPDLTLTAGGQEHLFSWLASADLDFADPRLDILYANFMFKPFDGCGFGLEGSYYQFKYNGYFQERLFGGIGLNCSVPLSERLTLSGGATIPLAEWEHEPRHDYMIADRAQMRTIGNLFNDRFTAGPAIFGPVPWQGRVGFKYNGGDWGVLEFFVTGGTQTSSYSGAAYGPGSYSSFNYNFGSAGLNWHLAF